MRYCGFFSKLIFYFQVKVTLSVVWESVYGNKYSLGVYATLYYTLLFFFLFLKIGIFFYSYFTVFLALIQDSWVAQATRSFLFFQCDETT